MSFSILEQQYVVTIPLISLEATQLGGTYQAKRVKVKAAIAQLGPQGNI